MLKIKNIESVKSKEFQWAGHDWVLYGVDVSGIEYKFIFIPMEAGRYDTQKAQLVILNRIKHPYKKAYKLWTTAGEHTYIHTNDIPNWSELVKLVYQNRMVCN